MSANPYHATNTVTAERASLADKSITFAIYSGVASAAALGILFWGALVYVIVWILSQHRSIHEYLGSFKFGTIPFAFVPFLLAFGIHKRSRLCAAVPVILYPGFMAMVYVYGGASMEWDWSLCIPIAFTAASVLGLIGTILHHRQKKPADL